MRPIRRALELLSQGEHSRREIARICRVSRPALAEYELRAAEAGLTWPLQPEIDDAALETLLFPARKTSPRFPQPDWAEIHQLLRTRKDATLVVLHDEYIAANPGGMKYATFCKAYRAYARKQKSTMRFVYRPGDVAFVDYAGRTITVVSEGHAFEAQIFVAVLGSSGMIYAEATQSQKIPDWLGSHQRAFSSWGGTPRTIVCDNLKSAVTRASYKGEPELQQQYAELARHYGINILPARPRRPQDKASAEKAVQSVGRWVLFSLRNEHFTSLHDLNEAIRKLVLRINQKPIRRLKLSRQQLFESSEQAALQPLPATKWEYAEYHLLCVHADYHVEYGNHSYSLPHDLIGERVEVRATVGCVDIYHRGKLVATHQRSYVPGRTTEPAHQAPHHKAYLDWNPDQALQLAGQIGSVTQNFLAVIFAQDSHTEHQRRAWRSIQAMEREFTAERLEKACSRALTAGADSIMFIRNLLRNHREALMPTGTTAVTIVSEHQNLRASSEFTLIKGGRKC